VTDINPTLTYLPALHTAAYKLAEHAQGEDKTLPGTHTQCLSCAFARKPKD